MRTDTKHADLVRITLNGRDRAIEVYVDAERIAQFLGPRAIRSKSGIARALYGAVKVKEST